MLALKLSFAARVLAFFVTSMCIQCAVAAGEFNHAPVVYKPTTSTESLLDRYSQVHSQPNEFWQLTTEEWTRYETLKNNSPWAVWDNNSSPLAILAHYSESIEEKRRYARIEAELDTWRQYRVVEFQALYDKERSIVHERYVEWIQKRLPTLATIKPYEKLRLFIQAGDCDVHCRSLMTRVLKTQAKVDIFVVGAKSDEQIFSWAERAGIPVERVKTKEITLNHDNDVFSLVTGSLGIPAPKLPSLFRQVAGGDQVVAI
jgi:integrating conjugative element protein (TIGR03759 family)